MLVRYLFAAAFAISAFSAPSARADYRDYPLYAVTLGANFVAPPTPPTTVALGDPTATGHGGEYGFGYLWANRMTPPALVRVDPQTGASFEIALGTAPGNEPRSVATGPTFVAVSDLAAGKVYIVDPASSPPSVVSTITGLLGPYGLVWDLAGNLYVGDGTSSAGYIKKFTFSGAAPALAISTQVGARPMFGALDGDGNVWWPCFYANKVVVLDTATLTIQHNYTSGTYPYEAFRDAEGARMLVTENGYTSVLAYNDNGSNARVYMPAGSGPAGIRRVPGGNIYVALSNSNALGIISPSLTYLSSVSVGSHPSKVFWAGVDIWNVNSPAPASLQRTKQ